MRKCVSLFIKVFWILLLGGLVAVAQDSKDLDPIFEKLDNQQQINKLEKELISNYFASIRKSQSKSRILYQRPLGTESIPVLGPESFDVFPPADWQVTSGSSGNGWFQSTNTSYGAGADQYAAWDDDLWGSASDDTTELITNAFSTEGLGNVILSFDYGYRQLGSGTFSIEVSSDNGVTWQEVVADLEQTSATSSAQYPESVGYSLDITNEAGQSSAVMIKFVWRDAGGFLWYGALDNVAVDEGPALDVGPIALVSPNTPCPTATETVTVRFQNFGSDTLFQAQDTILVEAEVDGPTGFRSFGNNVAAEIPPGGTFDVTAGSTVDMSVAGVYTWTLITTLSGDSATANDTLTLTLESAGPAISGNDYFEHFDSTTAGAPGTFPDGWRNDTEDDEDWFVEASGTANSSDTGPLNDNSGTGNYVYTEATGPAAGAVYNLLSPCLDLTGVTSPSMNFYYHMFGAAMGELHIDVFANGVWTEDVGVPIIGQQQTAEDEAWRLGVVDLSAYADQIIVVRFRGIRGDDFTSDIAIDDVSINAAVTDLAVSEFIGVPAAANGSTTVDFDVVVTSIGATPVPSATLDIWQNGAVVTSGTVDSLNAGETDTLNFTITTSAAGSDELVAALQAVAGDDNQDNDTLATSVGILAPITVPWIESWETTEINPLIWPTITGGVEAIDVNGVSFGSFPFGVPSDPYFLTINDSGSVIESYFFDMSAVSDYFLVFWESEHDLELGEDVIMEYYSDGAGWDTLQYFAGTNNGFGVYEPFERHAIALPADAYHDSLKLRIRTIGDLASTDEWFFDDIELTDNPNDINVALITQPVYTQIARSQSGILGDLGVEVLVDNLGLENTGDLTLDVSDSTGASVFSDVISGATLSQFSDTSLTFASWDAEGIATGPYSMTVYSSGFDDTVPGNDTTGAAVEIGSTMAYDNGVQSTSGTFSSTARSWFATIFELTRADTMHSASILVSEFTADTDSFGVYLYDVVGGLPGSSILTLYEGSYADLGARPVLAQFSLPGGVALDAGSYALVFDMRDQTFAGGSFPCGIDFTALGAQNVPNTFFGMTETIPWSPFELVGAETWTPIMRIELGEEPAPKPIAYEESFEGAEFPPTGWSKQNPDGGGGWIQVATGTSPVPGWTGGTVTGPDGGGDFVAFATWNTGGASSNDQWLITPKLLDVKADDVIDFWMRYWPETFADTVEVLMSTTGNDVASFDVTVATLGFGTGSDTNWVAYNYNITDFVAEGSDVYVAFRERVGDNYNNGASISFDLFSTTAQVDTATVVGGPNPPLNLTARPGDGSATLDWAPPLEPGEIVYDDGSSEQGFGFAATGEFAVRFTPNVYPSTLLEIKTWWHDTPGADDNVEYSVFTDENGANGGPVNEVITNTAYTVPSRGDWSRIDVSTSNIEVNSGDFYYAFAQIDTVNYFLGFDTNSGDAGRAWLTFDGGVSWQTLAGVNFPFNFMVRAIVQEGTGTEARIVELEPQIVRHTEMTAEMLAGRKANAHLFDWSPIGNNVTAGYNNILNIEGDGAGVGAENVNSYNIYRSTDDITFDLIGSVDSLTLTYTDETAVNNTLYYYYVTAVYDDEGESGPSNTVSVTPVGDPPEELLSLEHTPGDLTMGIFNDGSIGAEQVGFTGPGVTWKGVNGLFVGGPIFGTADAASVNGHIGSFGQGDDIVNVTSLFVNGFTSDANFDQVSTAYLDDSGAPAPFGVKIIQKSYSNTGDNFAFIRYGFINTTAAAITDFTSGIFIDWDIDNFQTNEGGISEEYHLVYQWDPGDSYYGFAAMDGLSGGRATTDGGSATARTDSYTWITTFDPNAPSTGDVRSWGGSTIGDIAAGDTVWVTWAMVAGDDLDQILANTGAAHARAFELGWTDEVLVGIDDEQLGLPIAFDLEQNYPNPFNPTTTIEYALKERVDVSLKVYNVLGQLVRTLVNANQVAGFKKVNWDAKADDGTSVASGIYIYRLEAGSFVESKKMILLK